MALPKTRKLGLASLLAILFVTGGCLRILLPPKTPIPTRALSEIETGRCLVALLPGRFGHPRNFAKAGFHEVARAAGLEVDLVAVDAHLGYYRDRSVATRIRQDVVLPARERGYEQIWLAGVSLGGLGSILYARENPGELDGVFAVAPFLGEEELVEEMRAQGGPRSWRTDEDPLATTLPGLWHWLQLELASEAPIALHLAYGIDDELAAGAELLAELLPPEQVYTVPGGHDWKVWEQLWERFVASGALCSGP